ncbi:uncharacterized protein LOC110718095 [Chenopodium quinoa]|uniref:uncharacterized protein LOC110718095 n=1 Tax=Chenopodium quinoa TaxID=63459 RepID=UPI000B77E2FF|nr:uncharacterized protein LOC110718095 [Chenopodium quinoa]
MPPRVEMPSPVENEAGQSHCFNMVCPGFVNVNHEFPVHVVLEPMSKRGGVVRTRYFSIFKDPKDGNWWLITGYMKTVQGFLAGKDIEWIGKFSNICFIWWRSISPRRSTFTTYGKWLQRYR